MDRRENAEELLSLHQERMHEKGWRPLTPADCRRRAEAARDDLDREGWREAARLMKEQGVA
jgi:hypothetical protein